MRHYFLGFLLLAFAPPAVAATATANFTVTISPPTVQTIVSISPTTATVNTVPCPNGTVVTGLTATMSNGDNPPFSGTWSETGDSNFRISGANLVCNGAVPANTYMPTVTATPSNHAIAPLSRQITVTIQTGVAGTCGVPPFDGSICPPLPAGTSNWVYIGGDEFNGSGSGNFLNTGIYQYTYAEGDAASGESCVVLQGNGTILPTHVIESGGILRLFASAQVDCVHQPAYPTHGACSSFSFCAGPSIVMCLAAPSLHCIPTDPGGIYVEARVAVSTPYMAFWTVTSYHDLACGTPPGNIETGGLESDIVEEFGGGDPFGAVYGGYGGNPNDCPGNSTNSISSGVNLADGNFHLIGARYVLGTQNLADAPPHSTCKYTDGRFVGCIVNRFDGLGGPTLNGAPDDVGIILMYAWGNDNGTGGETDYDWVRVYRAE